MLIRHETASLNGSAVLGGVDQAPSNEFQNIADLSAPIPSPFAALWQACSLTLILLNQPREIAMNASVKVITIGKRVVSADQIAFIEPFDPAANPEFKPEKDFKGRVVLLDRDAVLTEQTPKDFAEANELLLFAEDDVAVSRTIVFKIETFEPTENFKPSRPFKTRLKWSDAAGVDQSKLLLTSAETVIAEILKAKGESASPLKRAAKRPARGRKGSPRMEAFQS
jgi:hypothetical protein